MKNLYKKKEVIFAILLIMIYVVVNSVILSAEWSEEMKNLVTFIFNSVFALRMIMFIKRENLDEYYGIGKMKSDYSKYLYFVPFALIACVNLWFGVETRMDSTTAITYICSMVVTGIVEELLFRGFLFKAMENKNVKSAIILSSLTFGLGHIVNLFNGSGMELINNVCQLFYAVAIGFMLVAVFYTGKSIIPCMIFHSFFNASSAFARESLHEKYQIPIAIVLCLASVAYTLIIFKNHKGVAESQNI